VSDRTKRLLLCVIVATFLSLFLFSFPPRRWLFYAHPSRDCRDDDSAFVVVVVEFGRRLCSVAPLNDASTRPREVILLDSCPFCSLIT